MSGELISQFRHTSALSGGNAVYVEDLYEQYLANPQSVDSTWQALFA